MKQIALLLLTLALCGTSRAQDDYAFTKEKVYLHSDHVFYRPGTTIYFKAYVVQAATHKPTRESTVLHAELVNPSGNVVQKLTLPVKQGASEGSFDIGSGAAGGVYRLRAYTSGMRNESETRFFTREITVQKIIAPRVLMKLDVPGKGLGAGSDVVAHFSMRALNGQPIRNKQVAYEVALGGALALQGSAQTDNSGTALIRFTLPADLNTTDGLLHVRVQHESYTESIARALPIVLNRIDLQFLPEGGTLVWGLRTNMAFRAVNEFGKAADVRGEIIDDRGHIINRFESFHFGMGQFAFTPEQGRSYFARITAPASIAQQFALPSACLLGQVLNVRKEEHRFRVRVGSTEERNVRLKATIRGQERYSETLRLRKGDTEVDLDERQFPMGIVQFTLEHENGMPIAERVIFANEDRPLQIEIQTSKERYAPRECVQLTVRTLDHTGKPVPSSLSLAVVDDKLWTMADDKQDEIRSWLLLHSELKTKVEEPRFYFKADEPKAFPAVDLVLLTHGYRYFEFSDLVRSRNQLQFANDQPNILGGRLTETSGSPAKGLVYLVEPHPAKNTRVVESDADGNFFFTDVDPGKTYYLFAKGKGKQPVTIQVTQNGFGSDARQLKMPMLRNPVRDEFLVIRQPGLNREKVSNDAAPTVQTRRPLLDADAGLSEVVVVSALGVRKREIGYSATTIRGDELSLAATRLDLALAGRVPGIVITNNKATPGAAISMRGMRSISGANPPLYLFDGIPVDGEFLQSINPNDIHNIQVLRGASATSIYGSLASGGAVIIETKKGGREGLRIPFGQKNIYSSLKVQTPGNPYSVTKRFYVPTYTSLKTEERDDFRETIYWNGMVQTGRDGTATVSFPNSDATTTFRAIAEGIGFNGNPGHGEATYAVAPALSVDVKIPPYLTVGDEAALPLHLKNHRSEPLQIRLSVEAPAGLSVIDFPNTVYLEAGAAKKILVPVRARSAIDSTIRFVVESDKGREVLVQPISAVEKGFPVVLTYSGNTSADHRVPVSSYVPGTLKAGLVAYRNPDGLLLEGIESMLREPYGCFEQTSSATYPNVFVLKYLKASGKLTSDIEEKALAYIRKGYQRLISFETGQHGFEWFGHTPPHEALTAYGLLEFTDMQEFVAVDQAMLARTRRFLLNRRDGKGGFQLSSAGYDRFASVPNRIANLYIVYALSQAGIGAEIEKEYQAGVEVALKSEDGYQLGLMALAASNLRKQSDYRRLMDVLNALYRKNGCQAETSVTNSRASSLKVETLSLYALALMREGQTSIGSVGEVITRILGEKNYYGYGSTQATVLALKALVEYLRLAGPTDRSSLITFEMNGQRVGEGALGADLFHTGANAFAVRYEKNRAFPYQLQVAYHTLIPPTSEQAEIQLKTTLVKPLAKVGETVRMTIDVRNTAGLQPMTLAKVGIPAGLSLQPWQLKEMMEKKQVAYYEIFDNYLVLYWMGFAAGETRSLALDLKAEIAGSYTAKASVAYLYYTPEFKYWCPGAAVRIED